MVGRDPTRFVTIGSRCIQIVALTMAVAQVLSRGMSLSEWIDLTFLKICVRHTCANIAAMMSFTATDSVANVLLDEGRLKFAIHGIEQLALLGSVLWVFFKLGVLLWRHRIGPDEGMMIFVA
jgi:hypothetical protein